MKFCTFAFYPHLSPRVLLDKKKLLPILLTSTLIWTAQLKGLNFLNLLFWTKSEYYSCVRKKNSGMARTCCTTVYTKIRWMLIVVCFGFREWGNPILSFKSNEEHFRHVSCVLKYFISGFVEKLLEIPAVLISRQNGR